ncbi:MAG: hypothetical protein COV74_10575 [Candidatus Omnitrophica bacterium CG11_big_fil_rev_8_21_14_0_20_45_26]|uniref:Uncharacterized protein n=1 Tax=Candidatus Abzuiibacterium crystallinum TaxID=1974748 RepID=A0A2H0LMY2_9BACT|nr:MAG: hypothetical protein COV74_10575 [Candidatus Omnitrophica bacterium CG11_big_fil_rev_8_21_14_0_20_45_26]PIW63889.1 MAG: hypothetical protein COW12_08235 [Candidatus Omnitrophica bacterium CG12_big_fil_rev_8_21_14_0_65_45_16]
MMNRTGLSRKDRWQKKRPSVLGLSLVELMLTLMVLSVMVVIVTGTVSLSKLMLYKQVDQTQVDTKANRIMNLIMRELREAKQGIGNCGTNNCSDTAWNNPNNICAGIFCMNDGVVYALSFKIPEKTTETGTAYKTIRYDMKINAHEIQRREISSIGVVTGPTTMAKNTDAFVSFIYGNQEPSLRIFMSAYDSRNASLKKDLYNEVSFRNK